MNDARRAHILELLYPDSGSDLEAARLGDVCRRVTGVSGAGLMLMSGDTPWGSVVTTDDASAAIEDLQFAFGEGPCVDAYNLDRPVLEPDLARPAALRWVAFTPAAVAAGARAVFGFPLRVGAVRLGALNLYCQQPGELSAEQHATALVMADVAAQALLIMQAKAPPGALAEELERGSNFQFVVHQAAGMVTVQLGTAMAEALIRLRAHAFTAGRPLDEVARDVVARRLRLDDDRDGDPVA